MRDLLTELGLTLITESGVMLTTEEQGSLTGPARLFVAPGWTGRVMVERQVQDFVVAPGNALVKLQPVGWS